MKLLSSVPFPSIRKFLKRQTFSAVRRKVENSTSNTNLQMCSSEKSQQNTTQYEKLAMVWGQFCSMEFQVIELPVCGHFSCKSIIRQCCAYLSIIIKQAPSPNKPQFLYLSHNLAEIPLFLEVELFDIKSQQYQCNPWNLIRIPSV